MRNRWPSAWLLDGMTLIADDGSTLYVGIEGVNQIVRLEYGKDGLLARLTI